MRAGSTIQEMADLSVELDVLAAAAGDHGAWVRLHDRYANLIWSIARGYRLDMDDARDVCQITWLHLAESLSKIRDPSRVKFWLATTAHREAQRAIQRRRRLVPTDVDFDVFADPHQAPVDDRLVESERKGALWKAFQSLPGSCQALLRVLMAEPPPSYAEVSQALDMPVGSIGPRRARCLQRLGTELDDGAPAARGG